MTAMDDNKKDLFERINEEFNSLAPKSIDNKLLSASDKISSKVYSKTGASNNKISQYCNMAGALASAVAGGSAWEYSQVFGISMILYAGMHAIQATLSSKRAEIDKRDIGSKVDEEKIIQYAVQQNARKNERFRRMGTLGVSIGFGALATISTIMGVPFNLALSMYAFSAAAFLDSTAQYFKAAEITPTEDSE